MPEEGDLNGKHEILLDGSAAPIAIRDVNIISVGKQNLRPTTEQLCRERDEHVNHVTRTEGEYADASQLSTTRTMMDIFITEEK